MNQKAMIGIGGGVLAVVAVIVIYLVGFSGGPGPAGTGGGDNAGKVRAEKLFAGVTSSEQFKAGGGKVTWDSADAQGDQGVLIKNIKITGKDKQGRDRQITIDEFKVTRLDWNKVNGSPFADVEIKGLRSPQLAEEKQFKEFMTATGMKELVLDIKVRYEYKEGGKLMDLQDVVVTARDLGTLTLKAQIHGVDISAIQNMQKSGKVDPAAAMGMISAIQIGKVHASFKDSGAIDKAATMQAKKAGSDKEKILTGVVGMLEAQKAGIPFEIGKKAADAAIKFLKNKSSITVKAEPASPVSVLQLMMGGRNVANVDRLAKQLNVSVSAE